MAITGITFGAGNSRWNVVSNLTTTVSYTTEQSFQTNYSIGASAWIPVTAASNVTSATITITAHSEANYDGVVITSTNPQSLAAKTRVTSVAGSLKYVSGNGVSATYTWDPATVGYTLYIVYTTDTSTASNGDYGEFSISNVVTSGTTYNYNVRVQNSSGTALSGAVVHYWTSSSGGVSTDKTTDSSGIATYSKVTNTTMYASATKSGYTDSSRYTVTSSTSTAVGRVITLAVSTSTTYYYVVKVIDASTSAAVSGATVTFYSNSGMTTSVGTATTNSSGIAYLSMGTTIPLDGYAKVTVFPSGYGASATTTSAQVSAATNTTSYTETITISNGSTATYYYNVTVKDVYGTAISGATVTFHTAATRATSNRVGIATTNSSGVASFSRSTTGTLYVYVTATNYTSNRTGTVTASGNTNITLGAYYAFIQVVDGQSNPLDGVTIDLYTDADHTVAQSTVTSVTSDSNGVAEFHLTSNLNTIYYVATKTGYISAEGTVTLTQITSADDEVENTLIEMESEGGPKIYVKDNFNYSVTNTSGFTLAFTGDSRTFTYSTDSSGYIDLYTGCSTYERVFINSAIVSGSATIYYFTTSASYAGSLMGQVVSASATTFTIDRRKYNLTVEVYNEGAEIGNLYISSVTITSSSTPVASNIFNHTVQLYWGQPVYFKATTVAENYEWFRSSSDLGAWFSSFDETHHGNVRTVEQGGEYEVGGFAGNMPKSAASITIYGEFAEYQVSGGTRSSNHCTIYVGRSANPSGTSLAGNFATHNEKIYVRVVPDTDQAWVLDTWSISPVNGGTVHGNDLTGGTGAYIDDITSDITVNATTSLRRCTVTFNDGSASGTSYYTESGHNIEIATYGTVIDCPDSMYLYREGYELIGWTDESGWMYGLDEGISVTGDMTLTAQWDILHYNLTLPTCTNHKYTITFSNIPLDGAVPPDNVTTATATGQTITVPYSASYTIAWTLNSGVKSGTSYSSYYTISNSSSSTGGSFSDVSVRASRTWSRSNPSNTTGTMPADNVTISEPSLGTQSYGSWSYPDATITIAPLSDSNAQYGYPVTVSKSSGTATLGTTSLASSSATTISLTGVQSSVELLLTATTKQYYIDLNGSLMNTAGTYAAAGNISPAGTADVYINGTKVSTGVTDFYHQYDYGTTYEVKNIAAATGWTYEGLHSDSSALSGTVTARKNVILKFSRNSYTVTYCANDGHSAHTTDITEDVYYGGTGTFPSGLTRTGYTFLGWSTSSTATSKAYDAGAATPTITGNTTYYAVWSLNYYNLSLPACTNTKYTVSITASSTYGGTVPSYTSTSSSAQTISVPYGASYSITWASTTSMSGSDTYATYTISASSSSTSWPTLTGGTSVTATRAWTKSLSKTSESGTVTAATSITAATVSGKSNGAITYPNATVTTDTTETAQYGYNVSVSKDSGTATLGTTSLTSASVSSISLTSVKSNVVLTLTATTKQYYIDLNGSLMNTAGTYAAAGNISPAGTADVYINGTKVSTGVTDFYHQYDYGTTYEIKNITAATGWTYEGVYSGSLTGTITARTAVYLKFSRNSYTLTFNANGGTTTQDAVSRRYGEAYGDVIDSATATKTKTGYTVTFDGWWTAASGGTQVTSTTTMAAGNTTVYAHYTETANSITVTFNSDGGSTPSPASKTATYDSAYGTLPTVSKTGYNFKGWWTAKTTGGSEVTSTTVCKRTTNLTLYARWERIYYTVDVSATAAQPYFTLSYKLPSSDTILTWQGCANTVYASNHTKEFEYGTTIVSIQGDSIHTSGQYYDGEVAYLELGGVESLYYGSTSFILSAVTINEVLDTSDVEITISTNPATTIEWDYYNLYPSSYGSVYTCIIDINSALSGVRTEEPNDPTYVYPGEVVNISAIAYDNLVFRTAIWYGTCFVEPGNGRSYTIEEEHYGRDYVTEINKNYTIPDVSGPFIVHLYIDALPCRFSLDYSNPEYQRCEVGVSEGYGSSISEDKWVELGTENWSGGYGDSCWTWPYGTELYACVIATQGFYVDDLETESHHELIAAGENSDGLHQAIFRITAEYEDNLLEPILQRYSYDITPMYFCTGDTGSTLPGTITMGTSTYNKTAQDWGNDRSFEYGKTCYFTVTPDEDYYISAIILASHSGNRSLMSSISPAGTSVSGSFAIPADSASLDVTFTKKEPTGISKTSGSITYNSHDASSGSATVKTNNVAYSITYNDGTTATIGATPYYRCSSSYINSINLNTGEISWKANTGAQRSVTVTVYYAVYDSEGEEYTFEVTTTATQSADAIKQYDSLACSITGCSNQSSYSGRGVNWIKAGGGTFTLKAVASWTKYSGTTGTTDVTANATFSLTQNPNSYTISGNTVNVPSRGIIVGNEIYGKYKATWTNPLTSTNLESDGNYASGQDGNYITAVTPEVSSGYSHHVTYSNISAGGGTVSPTGRGQALFTFSSGSTTRSGSSGTSVVAGYTISYGRSYAWSSNTASDQFKTLNTTSGAVTADSRGTNPGDAITHYITSVLTVTATPSSTYASTTSAPNRGSTKSGTITDEEVPVTQNLNEITSYGSVTGLSVTANGDVPANGGSQTVTASGASQTITYSSTATRGGSITYTFSTNGTSYSTTKPSISGDDLVDSVTSRTKLGTIYVKATGEGSKVQSSSADIYQEANAFIDYSYEGLAISFDSAVDTVPAGGGTVTCPTASYSQTRKYNYTSGNNRKNDVIGIGGTLTYGKSSTSITSTSNTTVTISGSDLGSTTQDAATIGTFYAKIVMNGETKTTSLNVVQSANAFTEFEYGTPTFTLGNISDVAAKGGTSAVPSITNVSQTRYYCYTSGHKVTSDELTTGYTAYYGKSTSPTSTSTSSCQFTGNNLDKTDKNRTKLGTAYVRIEMNDVYSDTLSKDVYQSENKITWGDITIDTFSYANHNSHSGTVDPSISYTQTGTWTSTATSTASYSAGEGTQTYSIAGTNGTNGATLTTGEKTSSNNAGRITWAAYTGTSSDRNSNVITLSVSMNGKTATATTTAKQTKDTTTTITYGVPTVTFSYPTSASAGSSTNTAPTTTPSAPTYTQTRTQNWTSGRTTALSDVASGATSIKYSKVSEYDQNIYAEPDGTLWIRLFHHNSPATSGNMFSSTNSFTTHVYVNENAWFDMSMCNQVSSWELMVKQKALSTTATESKYRWVQNANPMTATSSQVSSISVNSGSGYTSFSHGGLFKTNSSTYLSRGSSWWGAVGAWNRYNSGIPAWASVTVTSGYMDVYLRVDNVTTFGTSNEIDKVTISNGTVTFTENQSLSSRTSEYIAAAVTLNGVTGSSTGKQATQSAGSYKYSDITASLTYANPSHNASAGATAAPTLSYSQTYGWNDRTSGVGTYNSTGLTKSAYTCTAGSSYLSADPASDGVITWTANTDTSNTRTVTISVTVSGNGKSTTVTASPVQSKDAISSYGDVTNLSVTAGADVAAGSGSSTVTASGAKQTVTYVSGNTRSGSITYTYSTSSDGTYSTTKPSINGSNLGTTIKDRTLLGTIYVKATGEGSKVQTGNAGIYQEANYVTAVTVTCKQHSYANAGAGSTSVSVTNGTGNSFVMTFKSGSTTSSTSYTSSGGTRTASISYSLAKSQNGFTAVNSSTGAITCTNRGTTEGAARTSANVTKTYSVTWTPADGYDYGNTGAITGSGSKTATCTQNENKIVSVSISGSASAGTVDNIPASGGTVTWTPTVTYSSGSTSSSTSLFTPTYTLASVTGGSQNGNKTTWIDRTYNTGGPWGDDDNVTCSVVSTYTTTAVTTTGTTKQQANAFVSYSYDNPVFKSNLTYTEHNASAGTVSPSTLTFEQTRRYNYTSGNNKKSDTLNQTTVTPTSVSYEMAASTGATINTSTGVVTWEANTGLTAAARTTGQIKRTITVNGKSAEQTSDATQSANAIQNYSITTKTATYSNATHGDSTTTTTPSNPTLVVKVTPNYYAGDKGSEITLTKGTGASNYSITSATTTTSSDKVVSIGSTTAVVNWSENKSLSVRTSSDISITVKTGSTYGSISATITGVKSKQDAGVYSYSAVSITASYSNHDYSAGTTTPTITARQTFGWNDRTSGVGVYALSNGADEMTISCSLPQNTTIASINNTTGVLTWTENKSTSQRQVTPITIVATSAHGDTGSTTATAIQTAGSKSYANPVIDSFKYDSFAAGGATKTPTVTYHQTWGWNGNTSNGGTLNNPTGTLSFALSSAVSGFTLDSDTTGSATWASRGTTIGNSRSAKSNLTVVVTVGGLSSSAFTCTSCDQVGNYIIEVTPGCTNGSSHFYYGSNISAAGGTKSPSLRGNATLKFTSGDTVVNTGGSITGIASITFSRTYAWSSAAAADQFKSINTSSGVVTADSRETTEGAAISHNVSSTLTVTVVHNSTYATGGTVSGTSAASLNTATITQSENKIVSVSISGSASAGTVSAIPASGGTVTWTPTVKYSSNSTSTTGFTPTYTITARTPSTLFATGNTSSQSGNKTTWNSRGTTAGAARTTTVSCSVVSTYTTTAVSTTADTIQGLNEITNTDKDSCDYFASVSIENNFTAKGGTGTVTYSAGHYGYDYYTSGSKNNKHLISDPASIAITSNGNNRFSLSGSTITHTTMGTNNVTDTVVVTCTNDNSTSTTNTASASIANNVKSYSYPMILGIQWSQLVPASGGTATPSFTYTQIKTFDSDSSVNVTSGATISYSGSKCVKLDPDFINGWNGTTKYDNYAGTSNGNANNLLVTRISSGYPTGIPNKSGNALKLVNNTPTGSTSPGMGGWYFAYKGTSGNTYVCTFDAWIPEGYKVNFASNSVGTGGSYSMIGEVNGNNRWQTYGATVTFGTSPSTSFFFYLTKISGTPTYPVTWYVSDATICQTNSIVTPNTITINSSTGAVTLPSRGTTEGATTAMEYGAIQGTITLNGKSINFVGAPEQLENKISSYTITASPTTTGADGGKVTVNPKVTYSSGSTSTDTSKFTVTHSVSGTGASINSSNEVQWESRGTTEGAARNATLSSSVVSTYTTTAVNATSNITLTQSLNKITGVSISGTASSGTVNSIPAKGGTVTWAPTVTYSSTSTSTDTSKFNTTYSCNPTDGISQNDEVSTWETRGTNTGDARTSTVTCNVTSTYTTTAVQGTNTTTQGENRITNYGDITGTLSLSVDDIPASGGDVTSADVVATKNCSQVLTYTSTATKTVTPSYSVVSGNMVSADQLPAANSDRTLISENAFSITATGQGSKTKTAYVSVYQAANYITTYGPITGTLSLSVGDIPASGGTKTTSNVTATKGCSQTITYVSGATRNGTITYSSISGSSVTGSNLSTTSKDRTLLKASAFSITATGEYSGTAITKSASVGVYQEANIVTGIELSLGSSSIGEGNTTTVSATGTYTSGDTGDVTSDTTFTSGNTGTITVSGNTLTAKSNRTANSAVITGSYTNTHGDNSTKTNTVTINVTGQNITLSANNTDGGTIKLNGTSKSWGSTTSVSNGSHTIVVTANPKWSISSIKVGGVEKISQWLGDSTQTITVSGSAVPVVVTFIKAFYVKDTDGNWVRVKEVLKKSSGAWNKVSDVSGEFSTTKRYRRMASALNTSLWYKIENNILYIRGTQATGYSERVLYTDTTSNNGWVADSNKTSITKAIIEEPIKPYSCRSLFNGCSGLISVENTNYIDTSECVNMANMFQQCNSLTTIGDISGWDTSKVTDMGFMFNKCYVLSYVGDLGNWNTSNVTRMKAMFQRCYALQSLGNIGYWDMSRVVGELSTIFYDCYELTSIGDLSNWNISSGVTSLYCMFYNCYKLTSIGDIGNWNTSNVTNMAAMFYNCYKLTSIGDIGNWNMSKVTEMSNMFTLCYNLTSIGNIGNWNISSVTGLGGVFAECHRLIDTWNLSGWSTSNVIYMNHVFGSSGTSLTECGLGTEYNHLIVTGYENWDTSKVTTMAWMFQKMHDMEVIDLSNWNISNVTDMDGMFGMNSGATKPSSLREVRMGGNPSSLTTCDGMFSGITTTGTFYYNSAYDYSAIIAQLPSTWVAIPMTYQRVDYIESTGTQWIDTGVTLSNSSKFKFDTKITASTRSGNPHPFFGTSNYHTGIMGLYHYLTNNYYSLYVADEQKSPGNISINAGDIITYSCTLDFPNLNYSVALNSSTGSGSITTISDTTSHISIFKGSWYDIGYHKCYGFSISIDDALARNLVPCYRVSDNVIGMYDTVNGVFYTNSGSGTFVKGSNF